MKLMVLDGNSVINRAYYGVRALTTKDGFFTNAIYGFLNILEKLRTEEQPDALCVTFDLKAPTFRHLAYDGYKATRHPMPDELAMQLPMMKDILRAMRIPIFECEGWEADDVIGTIGKQCGRANWDCVIVTGDRDSLQLIDEHVTVKLVSSKLSQSVAVNYDPARFREEYGFDPIHLIDLKALIGDSSDNIPGVAGVGPKTATQLLLDYGTLDGIYAHLDAIKDKLRAKLEQGRESAYMSMIWRRSAAKHRSTFLRRTAACSSRTTIRSTSSLPGLNLPGRSPATACMLRRRPWRRGRLRVPAPVRR